MGPHLEIHGSREGPRRPGSPPEHKIAEPRSWPWLPTRGKGILARHAWCTDCGTVRAAGGRRPMKLGGIVNLLARLEEVLESNGHVVTEAQMRLVLRKIQALGGHDTFAVPYERQVEIVADVVAHYCNLPTDTVTTHLRSC